MKRSSWALDANHTHVETWLGSGWGGQLLDVCGEARSLLGGGWAGQAGGESDLESEGAQAQKGS